MTREEIKAQLADCKTTNRYVVLSTGNYWVFGCASDTILLRKVETETAKPWIMKPLRSAEYSEVLAIIPGRISTIDNSSPN